MERSNKVSTESCVYMFFWSFQAVLGIILWDLFSTATLRVQEIDKAGNTKLPAGDLVLFKLELMPNQWNSHLENTSLWLIRDVAIPLPNLSILFHKFTEKGDPEIHNKAF